MKHFMYKKKDNSVSERYAIPIGVAEDNRKLLAIDLTEFSPEEREEYEHIMSTLHKQYLAAIKEVGLENNFRYFFINEIKNV